MSVSIGDITARLMVVDKGSSVVSQFNRNLDVSVKQIQLSGNRLTSALEGMLSKAALLATAGMVARSGFRFLKESAMEAIEAEKAFAQLRAGVESTGGAAGKSAEELSAMADELSKLTGFDDELIAGGEAILLTFRRVRGEAFEQTMALALDLSARFGKDIDSSVVMIAKALDMLMAGSAKGLSALSKAGVTFTDQQKKQMEQLVRTGQAAEAQRLFFRELELQFGGSAAAARDTMGGALQALGVAWSNFKEAVGSSGSGFRIIIEGMIALVEKFTRQWQLADLGITIVLLGLNEMIAGLENRLQSLLVTLLRVSARATQANPFASDEQKIRAQVGLNNAILDQDRKRVGFAERSRNLEAEIAQKTMALLGILPKVQSKYSDIADKIDHVKSKQQEWFDDLFANLARQDQALDLLQQGMPTEQIDNLIEAAEALGKTNLLDPLALKAGLIKDRIDAIATAFKLADEAKKKFAELGTLEDLIKKQFDKLPTGSNDPEMQGVVANLRTIQRLTDSVATDEERRLATIQEALRLGIEGEALQRIILANNEEWNIELDETQLLFNEIYERLSFIAEGIAYDLVSNWRRAWEENESIVDATVDTLRDSFLNVLQDIISQWLSSWFKAMAAWLARWIATQRAAQVASAQTTAVSGASGAGGGLGSLFGMGSSVSGGAGVSTSTMLGAGLAAYALFVVYKGFIEDHERKFARVEIADGRWSVTASHGKKYLDGVQTAAEAIVNNLTKFLSDIDVEMERLGTVIVESSKHGWNVSIPGSTGKLFSSMEEAISYAQVLMAKYGQFADSVSLLVRSVISSTKAISIDQLASDIAFARELETQNLEQSAAAIREAMDVAIAQWKRAEDLFLSFYDRNLPAFAEATLSILTRLSNSIWSQYNQLAGIEEDPDKAWERKKAQYRAERMMIEAQIKLWALEIAARIANYNAQAGLIGGGGGLGGREGGRTQGGGGGILGMAFAMVQAAAIVSGAAEILDPALRALLDIQDLINRSLQELPPLDLPDSDPSKRRKGRGNKGQLADLRADLLDEIAMLEAEAKGPLHAAFYDFQQGIAEFTKRAKEAKLPAEDLAKGIELLTVAFQRSIRQQARDYAGLETEFSRRLREVNDFFNELAALGQDATGITGEEAYSLRSQALIQLGADLMETIATFSGLSNPMLAINTRANELIANLEAFAEAAGWTAEQIAEAREQIEAGVEFQRQQGINSLLGRLFNYLKEAGLYQEQAALFAQQQALLDIQLIEAQLRFYGALTDQIQEWIDSARDFVLSPDFGSGNAGTFSDPIAVKVVPSGPDPWAEFSAGVKELVEAWRDGIEEFVQSTKDLLTDESVTNLTQAQQLDFAKTELEQLINAAKGGDLVALGKLDAARREYLSELRESEGGGYGYDKGFEWVMGQTADILAGAQEGEQALMAAEFKKLTDAWELAVAKLSAEMTTTLYITTDEMVAAIYDAIGNSNPFNYNLMQSVGYGLMSGPVPNLGFAYDSLAPMDRVHNGMPYTGPMPFTADTPIATPNRFDRDALVRLSALETYNESMARSLATIKDDISAIRRQN